MQNRTAMSSAFIVLFAGVSSALAGKVPISPEGLKKGSELIVVGQVESYRTDEEAHDDGSKTAKITLKVIVGSVEKGSAKIGESIEVQCWRAIKEPKSGPLWDLGNEFVPAVGSKARFFLEKKEGNVWLALWPNGVKAIDDVPGLNLPIERVDSAPPSKAVVHHKGFAWTYVVAIGVGAVVLLMIIVIFLVKRPQPEAPADFPDEQ